MAAALCLITHTFVDAAGVPVPGVVVRFTPVGAPAQGLGFVARGITAVSSHEEGTEGHVSFSLMQGLRGTLTLTHVPLVREVTVPNAAAADLFELLAEQPDPFEPIDQLFINLPRSS